MVGFEIFQNNAGQEVQRPLDNMNITRNLCGKGVSDGGPGDGDSEAGDGEGGHGEGEGTRDGGEEERLGGRGGQGEPHQPTENGTHLQAIL